MTAKFMEFEFQTLVGTWWGIVGCILGPIFILKNLLEYVSGSFLIAVDTTKLRLEIRRLPPTSIRDVRQNEQQLVELPKIPSLEFAETLVRLFKSANASDLIYTEGCRWLDEILRDAEDYRATDTLKCHAASIRNYVGARQGEDLNTNQRRKFLYRFEAYLLEDTAPNREIAQVFLLYRRWLQTTYEAVDRSHTRVSDDIRDWYDRILSNQSEHPVMAPDRLRSVPP
jgi:hypothetical protein